MKRFLSIRTLTAALSLLLATPAPAALAEPDLISGLSEDGTSGAGHSFPLDWSSDGRFVLFASEAPNLVTNDDLSTLLDLFVRDLESAETELVSVNVSGQGGGNAACLHAALSGDGRYVAFSSAADNLTDEDTNGEVDIFLRDLENNTTSLVTRDASGFGPALRVPPDFNRPMCSRPLISEDGGKVFFESYATNLVAGFLPVPRNVYCYDRASGTIALVSVSQDGSASAEHDCQLDSITADGRYAAFTTLSTNLMPGITNQRSRVYVRDTVLGVTHHASSEAELSFPHLAFRDGQWSANGNALLLRAQNATNTTSETSLIYAPWPADTVKLLTGILKDDSPTSITPNGSRVAYAEGMAGTPPYVVLWDAATDMNTIVSTDLNGTGHGNGASHSPALSADGNRAAFLSAAADLTADPVNGLFQIYVRDLSLETTSLISTNVLRQPTTRDLEFAFMRINGDGDRILWESADGGIIADDLNRARDVLLHDAADGQTRLVSRRHEDLPSVTGSGETTLQPEGAGFDDRYAVFVSYDSNLGVNDTNGFRDIFLADLHSPGRPLLSPVLPGELGGIIGWPRTRFAGDRYLFVPLHRRVSGLSLSPEGFWAEEFIRYDFELGTYQTLSYAAPSHSGVPVPIGTSNGRWIAHALFDEGDLALMDLNNNTNYTFGEEFFPPGRTSLDFKPIAFTPDEQWMTFQSRAGGFVTNEVVSGQIHLYALRLESLAVQLISKDDFGIGLTENTVDWSISANSRWVALATGHDQNSVIRLHDLLARTNRIVCTSCAEPSLNADGSLLTYVSIAGDIEETRDILLHDLAADQTKLISVSATGSEAGDGLSRDPTLSHDARYVTFASRAGNLVADDNNNDWDIFVRDLALDRTTLLSRSAVTGQSGAGRSLDPILAADGRTLFFNSFANDLIPRDYNGKSDVFMAALGGPDTDDDQLDDDWEMAFFDTLDRDGSGDFDGDGHADGEEFQAGTDPTNEFSILRVLTLQVPGAGIVSMTWAAVPGKTYRVQYKELADDTDWTAFGQTVTPAGTIGSAVDTLAPESPQRYYRVSLVQD